MPRVFVTGSDGYVGKETVHALKDHAVLGADLLSHQNCLNPFLVSRKVRKSDIVLHLAAYKSIPESVEHPVKYYVNNIASTFFVAAFCGLYRKPLVFASSAAAYLPINPYARSKKVGEKIVRLLAPSYAILRYFNIGGATAFTEDSGSSNLFSILDRSSHITVHNRTSSRDYTHVSDIAAANISAIEYILSTGRSMSTDIFSGERHSVEEILSLYAEHGRTFEVSYEDREDVPIFPLEDNRSILGWEPSKSIKDIVSSEVGHASH